MKQDGFQFLEAVQESPWSTLFFDLDPLRRSSSVRKSGHHYINGTSGNGLNCNVKSYDGCTYSGIITQVSDQVRPCLRSPTLGRDFTLPRRQRQ